MNGLPAFIALLQELDPYESSDETSSNDEIEDHQADEQEYREDESHGSQHVVHLNRRHVVWNSRYQTTLSYNRVPFDLIVPQSFRTCFIPLHRTILDQSHSLSAYPVDIGCLFTAVKLHLRCLNRDW